MLTSNLYNIFVIAGVIFAALVIIGIIIARLYQRSSKEISFVRTGFGGEKSFWAVVRLSSPCFTKRFQST